MPYSLYEHVLGGLLGQAMGDAFAMPALLHPEATWKCYGGWLTEFHPGSDGHPAHAGLPAGRVTDDTEQANPAGVGGQRYPADSYVPPGS